MNSSRNLHDILQMVEGVLKDKQQYRNLLEMKGEDAQIWLDMLQVLAELPDLTSKLRFSILKMILYLSRRSSLYPQCLMIKNVKRLGNFPVGGGGFGDVWKGKIGEQIVCLKVAKVYLSSDVSQLVKEYMREAIVWQQLKHPNLLPFMGMYYLDKARKQLCLVSPWMKRGNLVRFLKDTPREDVDHYSLACDIAAGLSYLHSMEIVHGDLKGVNILITPDERACIGDFGLSRAVDTHALRPSSSSAIHSKGTTRWLSPELLRPDLPCIPSMRSDIYAFACVCYEIFTGNAPFHELMDGAVIVALLLDKKHPSRPQFPLLDDEMWDIMVCCWKAEPLLRPGAFEVLARLSGLGNLPRIGGNIQPAPDWNPNLTRLRTNVNYPDLDKGTLMWLQKSLKSPSISDHTSEAQAYERSRIIDTRLEETLRDDLETINVLLIGTSGSGKSMFLNQIRIASPGGLTNAERESWISTIHREILNSGTKIVSMVQRELPHMKFELADENIGSIYHWTLDETGKLDTEKAESIHQFYKEIVSHGLLEEERLSLDNEEYFLENVPRMISKDYLPSYMDILMCPSPKSMSGITELNERTWRRTSINILHPETQTSRKWTKYFDSMKIMNIILCVPLVDSDISDSLELFKGIVNSPSFHNTAIIILFTKSDLLEKRLNRRTGGLQNYFPDRRQACQKVKQNILTKFKRLLPDHHRGRLYSHMASLHAHDTCREVFSTIGDTLLWQQWAVAGLI